jgi:hypothetical protein
MANSKSKSPRSSVTVSKPPFKPVPGPFGGMDEQATIEAFEEYIGDYQRLLKLWRIARECYPMPKYPNGQYTRIEVLKMRAKRDGFTENEINGYLTFGN